MNSTDIKDYVVAILTKSKQLDEVPLEYIEEVEKVLKTMATAGGGGIAGMPDAIGSLVKMPDAGADGGAGAGVAKEEEFVKIDEKGQWSIEKAIKPSPTLNYKEINKPVNTEDNPANTINYKEMNAPKHLDKPQSTIDYKQVNRASPSDEAAARSTARDKKMQTTVGGTPEKNKGIAEMARRRAAQSTDKPVESALDTIKDRKSKV
jgi:hypothetical protein